jgi:carbonic anhydrase
MPRMKRVAVLLSLFVAVACRTAAPAHHAEHCGAPPYWSYEAQAEWPAIAPACGGRAQSPIDIANTTPAQLPQLSVTWLPQPLSLTNNGHTLQANADGKSSLTLNGVSYELVQFHTHTPSEHTPSHAMELHFVHKHGDDFVVIGVMVDRGASNPALASIVAHLPQTACTTRQYPETIDLLSLFPSHDPARWSYVNYNGSLTTPPCAERVTWMVATGAITASDDELAKLAAVAGKNNRDVQPRNGRDVRLLSSVP